MSSVLVEKSAIRYLERLLSQATSNAEGPESEKRVFTIFSKDGTAFYFHNFLRARCPTLERMLESPMREGIEQKIHLQADCCTRASLAVLHDLFYCATPPLADMTVPILKNLILMGDMLQFSDLTQFATGALIPHHVSMDNALDLMEFCCSHGVAGAYLEQLFDFVCSHFPVNQLVEMQVLTNCPALMAYYISVWMTKGREECQLWDDTGIIWRPGFRQLLSTTRPFVSQLHFRADRDILLKGVGIYVEPGSQLHIKVQVCRGSDRGEFLGMAVENNVLVPAEQTAVDVFYVRFSTPIYLVGYMRHQISVRLTGSGALAQHVVPRHGLDRYSSVEVSNPPTVPLSTPLQPPLEDDVFFSSAEDNDEDEDDNDREVALYAEPQQPQQPQQPPPQGHGGGSKINIRLLPSNDEFTSVAYLNFLAPPHSSSSSSSSSGGGGGGGGDGSSGGIRRVGDELIIGNNLYFYATPSSPPPNHYEDVANIAEMLDI